MWRLVDFLLFIIAIILLVVTGTLADDYGYLDISSVRLLFLAFFFFGYWFGNLVASKDRRTETVSTNLPLWASRVLFLWHPNPFRRRTIIGKIALLITFLVMFSMVLTMPDNNITYITALIHLLVQLANIVFFGGYVMKKS